MKVFAFALVVSCLFAATFACNGNFTLGEWSSNVLDNDCPSATFNLNTTNANNTATDTMVLSAALTDVSDDSDVLLTITVGTSTNSTSDDDVEAKLCVPPALEAEYVVTVSSNASVNVTVDFDFYYEFADSCVDVSSPSDGFCCWWLVALIVVLVILVIVVVAAVAGFMVWKKRQSHDKYIYDDA